MKAAILENLDAPLVLHELETPAPDFGQVLVRVLVSGLCGAQLQEIAGLKNNVHRLPHLLGHEGCGIVEAVGKGVTHVSEGDKVVMHWRKGEGIDAGGARYRRRHPAPGEYLACGGGPVVTLTEFALVSENRLTVVPAETPEDLCALLGCGLSTALMTIEHEAGCMMGESVLVIGCGGVGLNLILAARLAQAWPVYGVDIHDKRATALAMGATDFHQDRTSITGPFDVVIDTSGNPAAIEWGLKLLSGNGRFIMVGQPRPGFTVGIENARHLFDGEGKWIKATQGGGFQPQSDIPRYIQLWRSGAINLGPLISHRLPLARVNEGIDLVRAGLAGRVMIEMEAR